MAYAQVDVIVEGALDASEFFETQAQVDAFVETVEAEFKVDGWQTDIYVLWHGHDMAIDCEGNCAQYVTDGHPYKTYSREAN